MLYRLLATCSVIGPSVIVSSCTLVQPSAAALESSPTSGSPGAAIPSTADSGVPLTPALLRRHERASPSVTPAAASLPGQDSTSAPAASALKPFREPADVAAPRSVPRSWMSLNQWRSLHSEQLQLPQRARAEIVFLGDSITQGWGASAGYQERFGKYRPLNLGIGGDQTQHLLWRIDHGALDGVRARLAVVLIGVNNLGEGYSPEQTAAGIKGVVRRVGLKLPHAKILVLAILPAGHWPDDPLRRQIRATNSLLPSLGEANRVRVVDVGNTLTDAGGNMDKTLSRDFLHPTSLGYQRLSAAVLPLVEQALQPETEQPSGWGTAP